MADWRTYAKAARNTARKQAPGAKKAMSDSVRRTSDRAGVYARAARKAADEGTRGTRESMRRSQEQRTRTAAAAALVAGRRLEQANIGKRLMAALRDALLVGGSLFIIWFVLKSAGILIPANVVIIVIVLLMIVRFGFAVFGQFFRSRSTETEVEDPDPGTRGGPGHRRDHPEQRPDESERRRDEAETRRYDPRDDHEHRRVARQRGARPLSDRDDRRRTR